MHRACEVSILRYYKNVTGQSLINLLKLGSLALA